MQKTGIHILALVLLSGLVLASCSQQRPKQVPKMDFESFEPMLHLDNDTVYVINFWATWCKPCVKELPDFERLNAHFANEKVSVILVSLDFPNKHEELLRPFIIDNNLQSRVIHLTDVNANNWIDRVSPQWSGAIPATVIYKGSDRDFFEAQLTFEMLKSIVEPKLITQ